MKLMSICFAFVMLVISVSSAEVFWFEAEAFDEEKSNPVFNDQGLNVVWEIKESTNQEIRDDLGAFGNMYVIPSGANRDTVPAAAGLVYILPDVEQTTGWQLWIRCIMATGGSDSLFYQISEDGGDDWGPATDIHAGATTWEEWLWKSWNIGVLRKGEGNAIRIAERENGCKLDVVCLRNDGMASTNEEYEVYLNTLVNPDFAVNAKSKLAVAWGKIKSNEPR